MQCTAWVSTISLPFPIISIMAMQLIILKMVYYTHNGTCNSGIQLALFIKNSTKSKYILQYGCNTMSSYVGKLY